MPLPYRFQYRLTDREFQNSLRLNGGTVSQRWKAFVLVVLFVLPSMLLFWWLNAGLSLIWFGAMIVMMLVSAAHSFVYRKGLPAGYNQLVEFSADDFRHTYSHSMYQCQWGMVEEIKETSDSFQLKRLARIWLIPKRVLGTQIDEFREFFSRAVKQSLSQNSVNLYQQVFENKSQFPIYRFKFRADDLDLALGSKFEPVPSSPAMTKSTNRTGQVWGWLLLATVIGLVIYLGMNIVEPPRRNAKYLLPVIVGWILPFLLVLIYSKTAYRFRRRSSTNLVPTDECELRLTATGWAIGDRHGVLLSDWRDVGGIFHSPDFFGFKTINQQLNLIPRRIFSDPVEANRFLAQAMDLQWRSKNDDNVPVATVVESGNPYQTPFG